MPLQTSDSLPIIEGPEQPLTDDFLGPSPIVMSSAATNRYAIDARDNSRVIAGTVSTNFTGPISSVHAYYGNPTDDHKKIIDWLDPKQQKAKHSSIHEIVRKPFMEGSGLWFLESEAFTTWKNQGGSPIWIHGLVGCGKTVLCSSIIENIRKSCAPLPTQLSFFYCSFLDNDRQDLDAILRLFLATLCTVNTAPSKILELYKECQQSYPVEVPSTERLKQTLLAILKEGIENVTSRLLRDDAGIIFRQRIYFVIDALDEVPLQYSEDVLTFLQELASESLPWLHLLVTSRYDSRIQTILGDPSFWKSIPIAKEAVNDDIERYVKKFVHNDKRLFKLYNESPTVRELIQERLVEKGNGMFKWTALQLSMLKRLRVVNFFTVENELLRLPDDLNATYARILSQLDDVLVEHAVIALQWLTTSARYLFVEELAEACAIRVGRIPLLDDPQKRLDEDDILEMLHGLVIVENFSTSTTAPNQRRRVILAHFSVQEFLTDRELFIGSSKRLKITPNQSHLLLARSCFSYLYHTRVEENWACPLREYAWYNWEHHICPHSDSKKERVRRKAAQLYQLLIARVPIALYSSHTLGAISNNFTPEEQELAQALDWLPGDRSDSLKVLRQTLAVMGGCPDANIQNRQNALFYKYEPLSASRVEIRLVSLVPCLDETRETEGCLYHVCLEDKPVYDALSYTWGDLSEWEFILVDGTRYKISKNLGKILKRLRLRPEDESQFLWVDAICMNQVDVVERNYQVQQMPQIYRQARDVVIGFENEQPDDEKAINYLTELAKNLREHEIGIYSSSSRIHTLLNRIETDSSGWSSVLSLFERGWWERAWVTQEIVVAANSTFLYGALSLKFAVLEHTMRRLKELEIHTRQATGTSASFQRLTNHRGWQAAFQMWLTRREYQSNHPIILPQLLWRFKDKKCSDPRDMVYSVLGLVNTPEDRIVADYSKSGPEVYTEVTLHIISTYQCLDIFSICSLSKSNPAMYPIPSWVTDFSSLGFSHHLLSLTVPLSLGVFGGRASMSLFSAGGLDSSPTFTVFPSNSIFTVTGRATDMIHQRHCHSRTDLNEDSLERLLRKHSLNKVLETMIDMDTRSLLNALNNEKTILNAFWRTILAEQWNEGELLSHSRLPTQLRIPPSTQSEHDALCNFQDLSEHLRYIRGRKIILTQSERLCLAPATATKGDIIVVMPGGAVPYVLRPSRDNWELIGDCYIDGIMHGEAMQGEIEMETFNLV